MTISKLYHLILVLLKRHVVFPLVRESEVAIGLLVLYLTGAILPWILASNLAGTSLSWVAGQLTCGCWLFLNWLVVLKLLRTELRRRYVILWKLALINLHLGALRAKSRAHHRLIRLVRWVQDLVPDRASSWILEIDMLHRRISWSQKLIILMLIIILDYLQVFF